MYNINKLIDIEKQALEATYFDKVTVFRTEKIIEGNITKNKRREVLTDEKCSLSIKSNISPNVKNTNESTEMEGTYTLFISKKIKKGDKLVITRQDGEIIIALAGKPSFHITHYEISILIQERA